MVSSEMGSYQKRIICVLTIRNSKLHKEDYRNTLVLVNWYMPSIQIAVIWCLSNSALLNSPSSL